VENDYTHEIDELQAQVDAMVEAEEDPKEIAELQMQLQILRAIYDQASRVFEAGRGSEELRRNLALRGYGEWSLDNVYAFVFEATTDLPSQEHRSFLGEISETDFAAALLG
jgi:hypothetical protein